MDIEALFTQFFAQTNEQNAMVALAPACAERKKELIDPLMLVVRGEHPTTTALRDAVGPIIDRGSFTAVATANIWQRYAAAQLLGAFANHDEVFVFLWHVATEGFDDNLGGLTERAIVALAESLPARVEFFLRAYTQRPFHTRKERDTDESFTDLIPHAVAAAVLIVGFPRCPPDLQVRIKQTITFAVRLPNLTEEERSDGVSLTHALNSLLSKIDSQYDGSLSSTLGAVVHDHFLDALLELFRDDDASSICGEEIEIALRWCDEQRVIDACTTYLERWGGHRDAAETKMLIAMLAARAESLVTPRLTAAIDLLCERVATALARDQDLERQCTSERGVFDRKQYNARRVDDPYNLGEFDTEELLTAAAQWRRMKLSAAMSPR